MDIGVQRTFSGFHLPGEQAGGARGRGRAAGLRARARADRRAAAPPTQTRCSQQGVEVVNLANGTERNHEPGERVSVAALEGMLDVALALLDAAAASAQDAAR